MNFAGGTYVGVRYDSGWHVVARKAYTLSRASGADADRRAVINGVDSVHIINGIWAGYWVPLGGGAVLT